MLRAPAIAFACAFASILAAACGGNVVVDGSPTTGSGGTSTVTTGTTSTIPTGTTSTTSTTVTTTVTTTTTSTTISTWTLPCGGTVLTEDPSCQGCIEQACCAELGACAVGSDCANLRTCVFGCKPHDEGCRSSCFATYGAGLPALQNLGACTGSNCGDQGFTCSTPICDTGASASDPLCGQCLSNGCCAELQACFSDPQCLDCIGQNNPPPQCAMMPAVNQLFECLQNWCGAFCGQ